MQPETISKKWVLPNKMVEYFTKESLFRQIAELCRASKNNMIRDKDKFAIQHFIEGNNGRLRSKNLFSLNNSLFSSEKELRDYIFGVPRSKGHIDTLVALRYEDGFAITEITPELPNYNKLQPLLIEYLKKHRIFEMSIFELNKLLDERYKGIKNYIEIINSYI